MVAQKGSLMLLKAGDGGESEVFDTVGGLRASRFLLNQSLLDASCAGSGAWRALLHQAGLRSLSLEGIGMFTDSASEERVRGYAFSGGANHFRLYFGNGDFLQAAFVIAHYGRSGTHAHEELYELRLESSGEVTFTQAA